MNNPTTSARVKSRDPFLDNAKVILIAFVVVGHLIAVIEGSGFSNAAYKWIYSFHMPAFVVLSGYLSRSYRGTSKQLYSLIAVLLVPYFVFQVILRVEPWLFQGEPLHLNLFVPAWSNWYLLALFAWRLMAPVVRILRFPVTISVLIALSSVLYDGINQGLSGARILSYLPFFVVGFTFTPERLEKFKALARHVVVRIGATAVLVGVGIFIYLKNDWVKRNWLMMSDLSSIEGDLSNWQHLFLRLCVIAFTFLMLTLVLIMVPQRELFFTSMGAVTLTMYLLQELTLMLIRPYIAAWDGWTAPMVMLLMIGGVGYALFLGTPLVQKATAWLVNPLGTFTWLRRMAVKEHQP